MNRHTRQARRLGAALAGVAVLSVAVAVPAAAAWTTPGVGQGTARATALAAPSASADAGDPDYDAISVSFTQPSSNPTGTKYTVTRTTQKSGAGAAQVVCALATASPCVDTGLNGSTAYSYTVSADFGNWTTPAPPVGRTTAADPAPAATSYMVTLTGSSVQSGPDWTPRLTMTVTDNTGTPLNSFTISGSWSNGFGSVTCTTGAGVGSSTGTCIVDSTVLKKRSGQGSTPTSSFTQSTFTTPAGNTLTRDPAAQTTTNASA